MSEHHICEVCMKAIESGEARLRIVLKCDFCHRSQNEVRRLVKGPHGADICDECARICVEVCEAEPSETAAEKSDV